MDLLAERGRRISVDELNTTREAARRGFPGTHAETGPSCYDAVRIERRCYGARCL
jgi:hypothetical protein